MVQVEGNLRAGDHAISEHEEYDCPKGLEQKKSFETPDGLDPGGQLRSRRMLRWQERRKRDSIKDRQDSHDLVCGQFAGAAAVCS